MKAALAQALDQSALGVFVDADVGLGADVGELRDEPGQEGGRQRNEARQLQRAARGPGRLGRLALDLARMLQKIAGVSQQPATLRRRRNPLRVLAHQQLNAELVFQLGDGGRDGGLGDVEVMRGARHRAGLGDGDEIFQLAQGVADHGCIEFIYSKHRKKLIFLCRIRRYGPAIVRQGRQRP